MGGRFGKYVLWGAVLIGVYIVVENYTGAIGLTNAGAQGATNLVKAFQGR